jgi:hypothetical protein
MPVIRPERTAQRSCQGQRMRISRIPVLEIGNGFLKMAGVFRSLMDNQRKDRRFSTELLKSP